MFNNYPDPSFESTQAPPNLFRDIVEVGATERFMRDMTPYLLAVGRGEVGAVEQLQYFYEECGRIIDMVKKAGDLNTLDHVRAISLTEDAMIATQALDNPESF